MYQLQFEFKPQSARFLQHSGQQAIVIGCDRPFNNNLDISMDAPKQNVVYKIILLKDCKLLTVPACDLPVETARNLGNFPLEYDTYIKLTNLFSNPLSPPTSARIAEIISSNNRPQAAR